MILAANLLTDAFSTSHLTDIYKTTHNYNQQQHKNLNNHARTLLTYSQTKANKTRAWFSGLLRHLTRKLMRPIVHHGTADTAWRRPHNKAITYRQTLLKRLSGKRPRTLWSTRRSHCKHCKRPSTLIGTGVENSMLMIWHDIKNGTMPNLFYCIKLLFIVLHLEHVNSK